MSSWPTWTPSQPNEKRDVVGLAFLVESSGRRDEGACIGCFVAVLNDRHS
jgi:hypothetical protein